MFGREVDFSGHAARADDLFQRLMLHLHTTSSEKQRSEFLLLSLKC